MSSSSSSKRSDRIPPEARDRSPVWSGGRPVAVPSFVVAPSVGHEGGDVLRLDDEGDPLFARLAEWVIVLTQVLLGQAVDMRVGPVVCDLYNTPPHKGPWVAAWRV